MRPSSNAYKSNRFEGQKTKLMITDMMVIVLLISEKYLAFVMGGVARFRGGKGKLKNGNETGNMPNFPGFSGRSFSKCS